MAHYDVIVAGVGSMGSAACYQLAKRGLRVLGLEKYDIPHTNGSFHGLTRMIRLAYFEHPSYVPILRRAYALWRETEQLWGEQLLYVTGSIEAGAPDSMLVSGSLRAAKEHHLPHDVISAEECNRLYPAFSLEKGLVAVRQPDAGFVLSERAVVAHVTMAQAFGADIHAREALTGWEPTADGGVRVTTTRASYTAGRLIVSTGAWISDHVPALKQQAVAERQVLAWLQPSDVKAFSLGAMPTSIVELDIGHCYQFPIFGIPGFKIGVFRHLLEQGHADDLSREPNDRDEALIRTYVRRVFPKADGPLMGLRACLFTRVPDGHFIVDTLPGHPQVVVASPCSGHGFKFASVMGEILADLATKGRSPFDLDLFRIGRL